MGKSMLCRIILLVLSCAMIFSAGCNFLVSSSQPYGPKVTGDGTGGAIAVYEGIKSGNQHDFYVQKISPEGHILWGEKGVLIGGGYKEYDSFHDLHIVSDGSGGALVSWIARPSSQQWEYVSHVTSVDSEGNVRWQKEVRGIDHMISDGAGGAIIATDYSYDEETLFIIKIDSDGKFPWGEDGVYVRREGYCDHSLGLASDGNGGAIFVWQELRTEPGSEPHRLKTTNRIFAQRINSKGSLPWGQEGVLLYTTPEEVYAEEPKVISDGSGGAIVVWIQEPEGKIEEGSLEALLFDIYAQRVDAQGKALWTDNGVPLGITKGGGAFPCNHLVVSDGAVGAIAVWEDLRKGLMSMYAQKIDADGRTMWPDDGILFTERGTHALAYDGHGGAIIAWGSSKSTFKSERSYVQRIDSDGRLLWGEEGIRLNP